MVYELLASIYSLTYYYRLYSTISILYDFSNIEEFLIQKFYCIFYTLTYKTHDEEFYIQSEEFKQTILYIYCNSNLKY